METINDKIKRENKMGSTLTPPKKTKPSGVAIAAILSSALGCFTIGLMIVISEASKNFSSWLNWWDPGGALVGKTGLGVIVWLVSWIFLYLLLGKKEIRIKPVATIAAALILLAFLFSFPPFFDLFTAK
jgi:hypothetical protein